MLYSLQVAVGPLPLSSHWSTSSLVCKHYPLRFLHGGALAWKKLLQDIKGRGGGGVPDSKISVSRRVEWETSCHSKHHIWTGTWWGWCVHNRLVKNYIKRVKGVHTKWDVAVAYTVLKSCVFQQSGSLLETELEVEEPPKPLELLSTNIMRTMHFILWVWQWIIGSVAYRLPLCLWFLLCEVVFTLWSIKRTADKIKSSVNQSSPLYHDYNKSEESINKNLKKCWLYGWKIKTRSW